MPQIPLARDLKLCSPEDYSGGLKELITVLAFAFLPLWLGVLFSLTSTYGDSLELLHEFFKSGEALLVASALVGPLIYVITKRYGELPRRLTIHFPQGWLCTVLLIFICLAASAEYGATKGYVIIDPTKTSQLSPSADLTSMSLLITFLSIALFYLVCVLRNFVERGAANIMRDAQSDFIGEWSDAHE